jgi:type I restriction-modification system DNA methylase subunit
MLNILKPTLQDTFIDMAMGAGVFINKYIKYIEEENPDTLIEDIIKNIEGIEIDPRVF